jgi:hypothetical protein
MNETELKRFEAFVYYEPNTGCWLHAGSKTGEYSGFQYRGKYCRAHRVSYEHYVGPIPKGLILDHLCRVTSCVNPSHLEPVTYAENTRRGLISALRHTWVNMPVHSSSRKTHCPNGHEYTEENTRVNKRGSRECITCTRVRLREFQRKKRAAEREARGGPKPNGMVTHRAKFTTCPQGHEYSHHNGRQRRCRICEREADRRYREKKRCSHS